MSASDVKYHVKVPLNASKTSAPGDNLPTGNRVVTYNSSSGEFDMFPTNPVSLRYKYKGNSNNEFPGDGEYKLYSAYTNPTSNTSTNDLAAVTHIGLKAIPLNFEGRDDLNIDEYLISIDEGIIEIVPDTQNDASPGNDFIFGRYTINSLIDETNFRVVYAVTLIAADSDLGQQAGYEASFIFKGGGGGGNPVVQQARPLTPEGTDQYFTLSRIKDGTETVLSASAALVHKSIGEVIDTQSFEITVDTGSLSESSNFSSILNKNLALVSKTPFRLQASESLSPVQLNYEFPYTTPVAASTEHLIVTRSGVVSAGQKIDFITLHTHPYKGSGSYSPESSGYGLIWEQYSYARIEHLATSYDGEKTQQCTYHFTWLKINNEGNTLPSSLQCTSIENARSPVNGIIVDPARTTGSFNTSTAGLNIDLYHYNVDNAQHIFKYMFI